MTTDLNLNLKLQNLASHNFTELYLENSKQMLFYLRHFNGGKSLLLQSNVEVRFVGSRSEGRN